MHPSLEIDHTISADKEIILVGRVLFFQKRNDFVGIIDDVSFSLYGVRNDKRKVFRPLFYHLQSYVERSIRVILVRGRKTRIHYDPIGVQFSLSSDDQYFMLAMERVKSPAEKYCLHRL